MHLSRQPAANTDARKFTLTNYLASKCLKHATCYVEVARADSRFLSLIPSFLQNVPFVKRADPDKLRDIFDKFASVEKNGQRYMTPEDFIRSYLGLYSEDDYNQRTVKMLGDILDTSKDG